MWQINDVFVTVAGVGGPEENRQATERERAKVDRSDTEGGPDAKKESAADVQFHRGADESLQCFLVNLLAFVKVDRTSCVAFEAGVEEA